MTPHEFIEKWSKATVKERSGSQEHFIDVCRLLDEPTPNEADPTGETYAFEKGAIKTTGAGGWADVWKKGCFGWEYKGPGKDLDKAFGQLLTYSVALENPPLLIVCDLKRIVMRTNWTNTVQTKWEIALEDLADAKTRQILKDAFSNPDALKPAKTRQELTEEAAKDFAAIAKALRTRGHDPEQVAHFVNRMVFCMFAEDVQLLPGNIFTKMLERGLAKPDEFVNYARMLFSAMRDKGGMVGFEHIEWFNGGLFDDDRALELTKDEIAIALKAARLDWADIDASILGTLFERGLDPDKRSQLGAHYTDRDKIMMILDPVIIEPLTAEWQDTRAAMQAEFDKAEGAKSKGAKTQAGNRAAKLHAGYIEKLAKFRVLDPACGSGNFLNLALVALKDLEHKANLDAEAMGLPRGFPRVGPECVKGIEINPYAAELARVSIWIGEIQWMRRNGFSASRNPILRPLGAIECADALVIEDLDTGEWRENAWPQADVIVGNPPFLGGKLLRSYLGDEYVERLFELYRDRVRPEADLVCYWVAKAGAAIGDERLNRAGLVTTNSIRGGANREVLRGAMERARLFYAWDDEPWVVDGAAVRVSLIGLETAAGTTQPRLDGEPVHAIHSNLSAAHNETGADLTEAVRLPENKGAAFQGVKFGGPFEISQLDAERLLLMRGNPNGCPNSEVIRLWCNGMDVTRRPERRWCVDFGLERSFSEAAAYEGPFELIHRQFNQENARRLERGDRPLRGRETRTLEGWWIHQRPRGEMRSALEGLHRFIVVPEVAKYRLFAFFDPIALTSGSVYAIARDDDTTFGILHSRFHELWSLRMGTSLEDRPRYTPTTTFETFPFPEGLTPDIPASDYADDPRAQTIAEAAARLNELRENWLNPPDLVRREPEVVEGYPDRILPVDEAAAKELKKRTLTNLYNARPAWLDHAHRALDEAVADAYGWPHDLSEDDILARLFKLNQERAGKEAA